MRTIYDLGHGNILHKGEKKQDIETADDDKMLMTS